MDKNIKKRLFAAAIAVVIGILLFAAVMTVNDWDLSRLDTEQYKTNTYEPEEGFDSIEMDVETADIVFAASDDGVCKVVCREAKNAKHSVEVNGGTLVIEAEDNRKWYEHIGISFHSPSVTVYLPKTEYASLTITGITGSIEIPEVFRFESAVISLTTGDIELFASVSELAFITATTGEIEIGNSSLGGLDVTTSTGDIRIFDVNCQGELITSVTTGDVKITDVTCQSLISNGTTGDMYLKDITCEKKCSVERSTGNVEFNSADAAEFSVKTSTGDVSGSLRSEKIFITETSTGTVSVPNTANGGKCEITTSTGDIRIKIDPEG